LRTFLIVAAYVKYFGCSISFSLYRCVCQ
jgi:hypothetical protein